MTPAVRDRPSRAEVIGVLVACAVALALLVKADDSARREHDQRVARATETAQSEPARAVGRPTFAPLSEAFPVATRR